MDTIVLFKILQVIVLASVKYALTFPYALLIGLDLQHTMVSVTFGGIAGSIFFYYFTAFAIRQIHHVYDFVWDHSPGSLRLRYRQLVAWRKRVTGERVFSRRSRFLVTFRKKYGLIGIVIASPLLLSLPLGAYLLNKYYPKHKMALSYMLLSIISWATVFMVFASLFPQLVK